MKKYKIQLLILLITSILIISGCSAGGFVLPSTSPTVGKSAIPAETPKPSPTPAPSPSPSPSPSQTETSQAIEDWPTVEGLTLKDGVYYYEKGNSYGGEVGNEAGVVRENVYVNGEQTGGVCFAPEVCRVLLDGALAEIPKGQNKVKVIVPLDISNYDEEINIANYTIKKPKREPQPGEIPSLIEINCNGKVPIVSTTDAQYLDSGYGKIDDMAIRILCNGYATQNFSLDLAYNNVFLMSTGTDFPEREGCNDVYWGKKLLIKDAESTIYINLSLVGSAIYMTTDDLLTEGGKPVFIIAKG